MTSIWGIKLGHLEEAGSYVKIPLFVINHAFFGCYVSFREGYRGENKSGFHLFFLKPL